MASQQTICSFATVVFFTLSITFLYTGHKMEATDLECGKSMSAWSPAWEVVQHHWETFQNGFGEKSIYRGTPTQALEEAWNASLPDPIAVPLAELADLGTDANDLVLDASGSALAHLEVFQDLACLNLLRQHTYRQDHDYSYLTAFQGPEDEVMNRVDACVQKLRQALMCAGDATPYLIMLTPEKKQKESPDFNTLHYCRNFDSILEWTRERGVSYEHELPNLYTLTDE